MALTRKMLKAMGIEEEKIDQIIEAHTETVDALKADRDKLKRTLKSSPKSKRNWTNLKPQRMTARTHPLKSSTTQSRKNTTTSKRKSRQRKLTARKKLRSVRFLKKLVSPINVLIPLSVFLTLML